MIFNERKPSKKKRLTWYLNAFISYDAINALELNAPFTSNGEEFNWILGDPGSSSVTLQFRKTRYGGAWQAYFVERWSTSGTWYNEAYRTITFDEEPTGSLLTWLEANATPQ